ncbi:hypothetical protein [Isoptericola variabilis]|uniref:hypothetical protein n=1 Tax=Isoptericola variabilis TaxID=139208 RepID=UPI0002EC4CB3|nr:hypothetical protein [Isoptericola variabilis]TWH33805.1 hypothetical protein L600_001500000160 [Isoptericola variabilis J7]
MTSACGRACVSRRALRRASFGWFAYAPLSETTFVPSPHPLLLTALAVGAVGVLLVGVAVGIVVGRRLR